MRKAAYNAREAIKDERTGELYYFKHKEDGFYHEVILPEGADLKFKESSVLWNAVEQFEKRKNSQLCKEMVIALPDDKEVSNEQRIELTKSFIEKHFISNGVAVQLDIHQPHDEDKNWHAHLLITTRRFSKEGKTFHSHKARDLDPEVRCKNVVEADLWGELWRDHQNAYFKEKGLELRVDAIGILPQEHLGPVRMRNHMNAALERAELLKEANEKLSLSPKAILETLARENAVFKEEDIKRFIKKHTPFESRQSVLKDVLTHKSLLRLYDRETRKETGFYTLKSVREEEEKLLRFAEKISSSHRDPLSTEVKQDIKSQYSLSDEQRLAFERATSTSNLTIIQGRAGAGKSYTLRPIREAHEGEGYRVLGLAPTNKVVRNLEEDGFKNPKTVHSFLFRLNNNKEAINSKTLVIVDEAAMLSTEVMVELFNEVKKAGAKLLLVGDERQLSSIERGGCFEILSQRYQSVEISRVQRQRVAWQKEVSECLSSGNTKKAVSILEVNKALNWSATKEESLSALINEWARDRLVSPKEHTFILAQRNVDVDALNLGIRDIRKERGELGEKEYFIQTRRGETHFAIGDRIQFTETDKDQGTINGTFGILKMVLEERWAVQLDTGETITFNPSIYKGLRHGYAGTIYKAQGATLDKTYVLHDKATNASNSYVALTRQSKDLRVFINKQETKDLTQFVSQISREGGKVSSLHYYTENDLKRLEKEELKPKLEDKLKDKVEALWLTLKDHFHKNERLYTYERKGEETPSPIIIKESSFNIGGNCFDEIQAILERRLFIQYENKYGRLPNQEERAFHAKQAGRATEYFSARALNKGLTQQEINCLLERAQFESKRQDEIKDYALEKLSQIQKVVPEDYLRATLYGERVARIEGRLYEQDLVAEKIHKDYHAYMKQAENEFRENYKHQGELKEDLSQKHNLSETLSKRVANEVIRHVEKHGSFPSQEETSKYIKLAEYLDKRAGELKEVLKDEEPYKLERKIEFISRREAEIFLKENGKLDSNTFNIKDIQGRALSDMNSVMKQSEILNQKALSFDR